MANKFSLPIISIVDTPGAFPGIEAEERHVAEAIAVNLREMAALSVPIFAIVIGEGGSGGALGIAVANKVLILENAYYSVISPEGCAAILWKDRAFASNAAEALKLDAQQLKNLGIVDEIVKEPIGGAHRDWDKTAEQIKMSLDKLLVNYLKKKPFEIKKKDMRNFELWENFRSETKLLPVSGWFDLVILVDNTDDIIS